VSVSTLPAHGSGTDVRFVTLALVALLALVHVELWFGKGGVPRMIELQGKLDGAAARPTRRRDTATRCSRRRSTTSRRASRWSRRRRASSSA
jgi:cell division protein FtsB